MKEVKFISSNAVIGELYQDFNIPGSEWVHKAKRWIDRGISLMELGGYYERATLWEDVEEYSAPLPCDRRYLPLILVEGLTDSTCDTGLPIATAPAANSIDVNGETINAVYQNTTLFRLPLSNSFVIGKPFSDVRSCSSARGYINFDRLHTNFEKGRVLYVYFRPPLDSDGYPMVPDLDLVSEALNYWVIYKMSLGGYKHPLIDMDKAYDMWRTLYPQAKNKFNFPSIEEMHGLTTMLHAPILTDWTNELLFQ